MHRTEVVVILDRSGSMQAARKDHEGGLRTFVDDQKKVDGDVRFTLIQFDSQEPCGVVYDGTPIGDVKSIELVPRGSTPLLDAIGLGLAHVEKRIANQTPDQVIVAVITDGEENASKEFTKETIRKRIADCEAKGWTVLYLGANVDAFAEAGKLGTSQMKSANFANNAAGTAALYDDLKGKVFLTRATVRGEQPKVEYSDDDRAKLLGQTK